MSNVPLPSSFDGNEDFYNENRWQKFTRRLKEEPLIPIGCGLVVYALYGASRSIRARDPITTNRMFRARIYAQAFTLLAMVAGSMYYQKDRTKRKEFDKIIAMNKAKEKNEAWIRELEARDEEEKELKAKRAAAKAAKFESSMAKEDLDGRRASVASFIIEQTIWRRS
ncbi:MAG: Respiratory supercomplex factor 1, mitochondrial [Trizodia sp. TS-e1964]|nr:MAG: Respiratory supercomplex factor 1, mitochondrial [Trizodia sp. TS-e1964]